MPSSAGFKDNTSAQEYLGDFKIAIKMAIESIQCRFSKSFKFCRALAYNITLLEFANLIYLCLRSMIYCPKTEGNANKHSS